MIRNTISRKPEEARLARVSAILVVDDQPSYTKLTKLYLKQTGCRHIVTAKSAKEAFRVFSDEVNLIIVDTHNLPFCEQFRQLSSDKHIPILAYIPFEDFIQKDYLSLDVDGFLFKPIRLTEFKTTIRRFLRT